MSHFGGRTLAGVLFASLIGGTTGAAQAARPARLTGRVFVDTIMRPIGGAEVTIAELNRSTVSDDKGGFTIANIPAGIHRLRVRKLGFAMYDMSVKFDSGETVLRTILLPRLTTLDTVTTVGDPNLPRSFLDHRAVGLGHFMTRVDLEKLRGRSLASGLQQMSGLTVIGVGPGKSYVQSKRYVVPIRSITSRGSEIGDPIWRGEPGVGQPPSGCYPRVYLDRTLLNMTTPAEPVNINDYAPENLEAIEWFSGPAQTPGELSNLNTACGVLVLHTRRSP